MARARTAVVVFFLLLFSIQTSNHDAFTIRIKRMASINRVCNNNNKQGDCGSTRLHAQKSDNYNIIDGKQTKKKKRTLYKVYDKYSNDNDDASSSFSNWDKFKIFVYNGADDVLERQVKENERGGVEVEATDINDLNNKKYNYEENNKNVIVILDREARARAARRNQAIRAKNEDLYRLIDSFQNSVDAIDFDETEEVIIQSVKDIRDIPNKLKSSVEGTKQTIGKTVKHTKQGVNEVRNLPTKLDASILATKNDIAKTQESVQRTVDGFKLLVGLKKPPASRTVDDSNSSNDVVLRLASKAVTASGKATLWMVNKAASIVWIGAKVTYRKGKEKMVYVGDTQDNQVRTLSKLISSTVNSESMNVSDVSSTRETITSQSQSFTRKINPVVERIDVKKNKVDKYESDSKKNDHNYIIIKSPIELEKQIKDASDLIKELSDSMTAAEKKICINKRFSELNDQIIEITPPKKRRSNRTEIKQAAIAKLISLQSKKDKQNNKILPDSKNKEDNFVSSINKNSIGNSKALKIRQTQLEIDKKLEEAQALAKEISDALDSAEKALID